MTDKIYFEVFYHKDQYTKVFQYSFDTLEQAKKLINVEFPGFKLVDESATNYPIVSISISISNKQRPKEKIVTLYYANIISK